MDADPVMESNAVAELACGALIGSDFEREHGWHVNLMPRMVLDQLPEGWKERCFRQVYGNLAVTLPSPADLQAPPSSAETSRVTNSLRRWLARLD